MPKSQFEKPKSQFEKEEEPVSQFAMPKAYAEAEAGYTRALEALEAAPYEEELPLFTEMGGPGQAFVDIFSSIGEGYTARAIAEREASGPILKFVIGLEEVPRKSALNIMTLIQAGEFNWTNMKEAIGTAVAGKPPYQDFVTFLRTGFYSDKFMKDYNAWLDRHPKWWLADDLTKVYTGFAVAVVTEAAIARGVKNAVMAVPYAKKLFKGIPAARLRQGGFDDIVGEQAAKIMEEANGIPLVFDLPEGATTQNFIDLAGEYGITITQDNRLAKMVYDETTKTLRYPSKVGGALPAKLRSILSAEGVTGVVNMDNIVKRALGEEYINVMTTSIAGGKPKVSKATVKQLIDNITHGQVKVIDDLTDGQLGDLVDVIDTILAAPAGYSKRIMSKAAREVTGPPIHIFRRLGLTEPYMDVHDALQRTRNSYYTYLCFKDEAGKAHRKLFKKAMDEDSWEAIARFTNTGPDTKLPDELLAKLPADTDFYKDVAAKYRDEFTEPLADIAEARGLISSDPAAIAAGVPERKKYWLHWIHDRIDKGYKHRLEKAREAGESIVVPHNYQLTKALREKAPTKMTYGEFMERVKKGGDDILFTEEALDIGYKEELRLIWNEPEFKKMDIIIDALEGAHKGDAKRYWAGWVRHARNFPSPIDEAGNRIFNPVSEAISTATRGRWEASGRTFTNFTREFSRWTHRGLLGGRLRGLFKNLSQPLNTLNLFGHKSTARGFEAIILKDGRRVLQYSDLRFGRGIPAAGVDITTRAGWGKYIDEFTFAPIAVTDDINTANAYLSATDYMFRHNKRLMNELVDYGVNVKGLTERQVKHSKFWATIADAYDDGKFSAVRRGADYFGIGYTQWHYTPWNTPKLLRPVAGKEAFKYSNWGTYMWGAHIPQLVDQLVTGKDIIGMPVSLLGLGTTPAGRAALLLALARTSALVVVAGKLGYDMSHVFFTGSLPTMLAPGVKIAKGGYKAVTGAGKGIVNGLGEASWGAMTEDNRTLDEGLREFRESITAPVPGYLAAKEWGKVFAGERELPSIFVKPRRGEVKKRKAALGLEGAAGLEKF